MSLQSVALIQNGITGDIAHISLTSGELGNAPPRCCLRLKFSSIGGQSFQVLLDTGSSDLVYQGFLLLMLPINRHYMAVGCFIELYRPGLCKGAEVRHE